MSILTEEQAKAILDKVVALSKADQCTAQLTGSVDGNIRFALNNISTSGIVEETDLAVEVAFGKRVGVATINEFDDASLEKVVRRSEELATISPENPEYMPLLGPQTYAESITYNAGTAALNPDKRADGVGKSLKVAKDAGLEAAGFLENSNGFNAMLNSKGLFGYNKTTDVSFSVTVRNKEGTGSGYASKSYNDVAKMDTLA